ncbi:hypothetical protein LCGC14_1979450 [marine sediment metagenome]|uniref:Uncharacterized protein n=1 Tax=marine sediment metagenome TaxID=412755 RepID=A0A0F9I6B6_9ZZZZ
MALIIEWTPEQWAQWEAWVASRPEDVAKLARDYPPNRLYRLDGNQRVVIIAYSESATLRVAVTGQYNYVVMEREVFGIKPEQLQECELPGPDETLGCFATDFGLSQEQVEHLARSRMDDLRETRTNGRIS